MTYTPDYTITLPDGEEIPLLFTNRTFRLYSLNKGIDLDELQTQLTDFFKEVEDATDKKKTPKPFPLTEVPNILLLAHETWCRMNKTACNKTEDDADYWIDETGGIGSPIYAQVYKLFLQRFFRMNDSAFTVEKEKTEEKKATGSKKKAETA